MKIIMSFIFGMTLLMGISSAQAGIVDTTREVLYWYDKYYSELEKMELQAYDLMVDISEVLSRIEYIKMIQVMQRTKRYIQFYWKYVNM